MSNEEKLVDYLKRVSAELQRTRQRVQDLESREAEPIAIVSLACRFPGGVESPEELWDLVADGRDAITGFPVDRGWREAEGFGGFLDDIAEFDAGLFGIAPREALAMDPQQRLLLETSWELVERARIDPMSLRGSRTGVFVGTNDQDYRDLSGAADSETAAYAVLGSSAAVMSGRIAYVLGLEGPTMTVDTACSSSLVAMHLAAKALRDDECTLAVAGGVTLMSTPKAFEEFTRRGALAVDGRCKAFAAAADGTGWGEGVGLVLLERLSDAQRNGHRVLALLRGSAVNQDGASNGLTAPNGPSQQRVIRAALADARLSATDVDVVEAHGTGTTLGDPIEAQALLETYGRGHPRERPLLLGSVKSNIGHTMAAAGAAGVIKMVEAMRRGVVPPTLHVDRPTPQVDWSAGAVRLVTETTGWPIGDQPRRSGVSSFGVSGTNAHVILEQAPEVVPDPESPVAQARASEALPFLVSGRTAAAVRDQAARLAGFPLVHEQLPDVAWSLATTRAALEHRGVVIGRDLTALRQGLTALAEENPTVGVVSGRAAAGAVAFVFPGQGAQWHGMGRELLAANEVFTARMRECATVMDPISGWSLMDVVTGEDQSWLNRVDVVQPVSFAVMVSLAAEWESLGVTPHVVVGHSQGEIAAACVAGVLSLADAARVVVRRSRLIEQKLSGRGGMVSVALSADRVEQLITPYAGRISVAAMNGPAVTVVSGEIEALRELVAGCDGDQVRVRWIDVDYASHSAQVDDIAAELLEVLTGVTPREARIPMYSTVRGGLLEGPELDAGYWVENLRRPVRFAAAARTLLGQGYRFLVEVSAHPVLVPSIDQAIDEVRGTALAIGTLRRGEGGRQRLLESAARGWANGLPVDWAAVLGGSSRRARDLPTYAFQRQRYWLETAGIVRDATIGETVGAAESPEPSPGPSTGRFARMTGAERGRALSDVVRTQVADVLGYDSPDTVEPRTFQELGFDSLTAVEFRNRLVMATGLRLPATLVFDYPTFDAVVDFLDGELAGRGADGTSSPVVAAVDDDPVVIVAASCRYPGGIAAPEDLWRVVESGTDTIAEFPADRGWQPQEMTGVTTTAGGFLYEAADFDAAFFGISPREALAMDPQQRLLLESSWELFERAGIAPDSLRGSRTGVFIGMSGRDYGLTATPARQAVAGYNLTGTAASVASGRISYVFGLEGPAVTLDTACSSSLVALDWAVRSVRGGECSMAVAGGVTILCTPLAFAEFSRQGGLAADGRCKSFSAGADGTGWGEGVG
ncbi:type I polyketide synthase, partial [Nocardia sp. NPDC060259]|uniref:type I polyketide synthase n=1 Tax=Nocardia sp. NPDC060259 TaxID=3347088 RepID=UPI003655600F